MVRFALRLLLTAAISLSFAGAFGPRSAHAATSGPFETGLGHLASPDFELIVAGISELGSSGDARSLKVLEALESGDLVVDAAGLVCIRSGGGYSSAATGAPTQPSPPTRAVGVNNRVRRTLGPMVSQLRLLSPDLSVRREAALEMSKGPREDARAPLQIALKSEKDEGIRELLVLATARLDLTSSDPARRLAGVRVVREQAVVGMKTEMEALLKQGSDGKFAEPDAELRAEAARALSAIENRMFIINLVANTFYGLSLGSVLLLAALGLAITFGLMNVINMAHGEMLMLGAYTTYVTQGLFQQLAPSLLTWYLLVAVPAAFIVCAGIGVALERGVVRHLYGRPLETLLATWGISLMLIQTVRLVFGAQNVTVANPDWLSGGFELMPNLVMPYSRIAIVVFTACVVAAVSLLLRRTSFGLQIRAVTQNRAMAASMGIAAKRVDAMTFGLGSGLAGLGGVALSQLGNVGPELGQGYIVDSFMVVVLGGVGKLIGTVLGAVGLGLLNKYMEPIAGAVLGKIFILVLIVLFLQKRPQGLFAMKGRAAEVA